MSFPLVNGDSVTTFAGAGAGGSPGTVIRAPSSGHRHPGGGLVSNEGVSIAPPAGARARAARRWSLERRQRGPIGCATVAEADLGASDARLAAGLAAGDEAALAELYDHFAGLVYGVALRVTADRSGAEDVVQEVLVGLWQRPDRYVPERGRLAAYLAVVARRRAIEWVRRSEAEHRRAERAGTVRVVEADPVDDVAARSVRAERVRAVVAALPADQRVAVELAYFGGLSYREVAVRLGIAEGTAKSRLRLALGKLHAMLATEVAWS